MQAVGDLSSGELGGALGQNPLLRIIAYAERKVIDGIRGLALRLGLYVEPEERPILTAVRIPDVVTFQGIRRSCVVKRLLDPFGRIVETYYLFSGGASSPTFFLLYIIIRY
ncbi:Uncharacterised protein [uncultured archaeon]|nr:Uncharacterised protein [uncultured archaeon]